MNQTYLKFKALLSFETLRSFSAEAESEFVNVAQIGDVEVTQEGERHGAAAERAVDGNSNTRWDLKGMTF